MLVDIPNVINMEYIYILNYETGECIVRTISNDIDVEEWLYSQGYSQSSIHYMIGSKLLLDIKV